jgi:predicted GNAT family N-acyltransferase
MMEFPSETTKTIQVKKIAPAKEPELYSQVLEIRNELLRKPHGLSIYDEDLREEQKAGIILVAVDTQAQPNSESAVGCVVLMPNHQETSNLRLRQMAVAPAYQGQNIGRLLVESAEEVAKESRRSRISLHARSVSKGFYSKLGYSTVSDEFLELNIPHYRMEKEL